VVHLVKSKGLNQVIVFSNTKIGTARLARQLERDGVTAESIHGDKSQADRMKALDAFKAGTLEVLVATDVAARGLDVAGVPCVINYDLPYSAEDYVHRIGRTGRAGASGDAISLYTPQQEKLLFEVEKLIKRPIERGTLDLPSTEPARAPRSQPRTSGRRDDAPKAYREPARKPVDEFFLKPYEPSSGAATQSQPTQSGAIQRKKVVGVLLGAPAGDKESKPQAPEGGSGEAN
jgi:ATP-dependent RNA helicase RhlE